jgi:hypothetical protein
MSFQGHHTERNLGESVGCIVDRHAGESPVSQSRVGDQEDELRRRTKGSDPATPLSMTAAAISSDTPAGIGTRILAGVRRLSA